MLPQHTKIAIVGSQDLGSQKRQSAPRMDNLTYQPYLRVRRHGAQISDLEIPTNTTYGEETWFRDAQEDSGGEDIDNCGGATAVQITHEIAQFRGYGEKV